MKLLFAGDWAPVRPQMDLKGDGIAIGNLECAFADGEVASEKAYSSVLPRSCMDNIPSGGFAALSVANNHVNDAGNFRETYAELVRRFPAIQFFGTIENPYAVFESNNHKSNNLKSNNQTILIYPHWGMEGEYTRYPSPALLKLAREWIDAGAEGVFGSHSHVPQGRETYKGRPIYYSLGNFDFDHPEGKRYGGTEDRLEVLVENGVGVKEIFSSEKARQSVERASAELTGWNTWEWAKKVGPFNLKKNTASWHLRLKKNLLKTLPKFIVWQLLPKTILFRIAGLCR